MVATVIAFAGSGAVVAAVFVTVLLVRLVVLPSS